MTDYKLFYIGSDGHITYRDDYAALDDLGALGRAQQISGPMDMEIEVWQGARFIARVAIDGSASTAPQAATAL
jgi:hypothetical protein